MKKWITYTIGILLTLAVLAAVGGAGYRMGFMQGASAGRTTNGRPPEFGRPQGFDGGFDQRGPNFQDNMRPGRNGQRFHHGRGRMPFFFPLSALVRLAVIGLLVWLGYTLFSRSGWQFVRVNAPPASKATNEGKKPRRKSRS